MLRKITRILLKTTSILLLLFIIFGIVLYFALQSHTFQTWLGKKVGIYMTGELKAKVSIDKIKLDFFTKAHLEGLLITDQHKDTLLKGNVMVDIQNLDLNQQKLAFRKINLKDVSVKLLKYPNDSTLNFQFIIDYFENNKIDTTEKKKGWEINYGDIYLDNLSFIYKDRNADTTVSNNMNFNNLSFKNTYGKISDLKIDNDIISAGIRGLSTNEQCGFVLSNLTTVAKASNKGIVLNRAYIKTPQTNIKGFISFKSGDWSDYSEFMNNIKINTQLENTYICFKDVAYFAKELNGLDETITLSGQIKGYITDINLVNFNLKYRDFTEFHGNLTITGLPDFSTSFLQGDAKIISTNYFDLTQIPTYPFNEGKKLELPVQLKQLGTTSYRGKFNGFMRDFSTKGEFVTALGNIGTDLGVTLGEEPNDIRYRGKIKTENFNIGALAGMKDLKNLTLNVAIKGRGVTMNNVDAEIEGQIVNLDYNNYDYKNIELSGKFKEKVFKGILISKDPNADFDFDGKISFKNKIPEMDFISTVNKLDLKKLHFTKIESKLSTQILIVLKGDNVNNLTGDINFDNTIYTNSEKEFKFSTFDLKLDQATADKVIRLNTSYFNFDVDGRFNITNLPLAFNHFLSSYYPAFVTKIKTKTPPTDALKFTLKIKKFNVISELFIKNLMVSPNTVFGGDFDVTKNLFNISLNSDSIRYGAMKFSNDVIESYSKNNKINLVFKCSDIQLTDSIKLQNYFMYFVSKDQETKYNLEWNNKTTPNNTGKIAGKVNFSNSLASLSFDKFFITAKDSTWNLATSAPVVIDTSGRVVVNPLLFVNGNQNIGIAGVFSNLPSDSLVLNTSQVVLEQFNPLLQSIKLKLEGVLNGKVTTFNSKGFAFSSDLNFSKFKINNNALGLVVVNTNYNAAEKNIFVDGYSSLGVPDLFGNQTKNIAFKGFYYLDKKEESIDIDFTASPANLKLLNPFMEGILTINNALVTGGGKVHGSPDNIKVDGKLKLYNSEIKVDYTNVTYNMTGEVEIMPDQIRFTDLTMKEKGLKGAPSGTINGNIFHENFSKIQLDYDVSYRNMLVLNTTEKENKTFYGKLYGTGNIGLWGFLNNLHMRVIDTTNKNSKFILPLDGPAEVEESDFIHFVKKDTTKNKKDDRLTGFELEMFVNVTADQQSQIILDKKTGDILNVAGLGDLTLKINTLGKFEMLGDYYITNGDYRFTLENVINKKFDIDAGSSISWSGDPLGADINIITNYRQRASVAPLLNDTTGQYKGRVPVDCRLKITGKLFSPNIKFGVDFPSIDATARSRIDNLLSDEAELNRQVFSFLLFRSFVTPQIYNANGGGVTAGNAAASTGSEMLSNQVSSFLNSYVGNLTGLNDLNLGLNYRPGTQSNSEAVDLALSKQLFNNKVSVEGNFGVNSSQANKNSSGIIDVNIEYKLTDDGRYRLKGFNRSNDNTQITTTGGPYTQGIGLFYREEFDTFGELFKRYLEKIKKKEPVKVP